MADRQPIELADGGVIWVPHGMPQCTIDEFTAEWATVVRGVDSQPWQPEPVVEAHICCERVQ